MDLEQNIQFRQHDEPMISENTHHSRESLYSELQKGMNDISLGNTRPFDEAMADVKSKSNKSY